MTVAVVLGYRDQLVERAPQSARDRSDIIWLPEQIEAFMAVASPEMQFAMVLALHTGQRQGDILRLGWSQYDGASIALRQGKARRLGRTAPVIRIPCTTALKATLNAAQRRAAVMLTTKTGLPFKKRYFADQWEYTCKAANIDGLHFHDIRGTTVTMLAEAGCNPPCSILDTAIDASNVVSPPISMRLLRRCPDASSAGWGNKFLG